MRLLLLLFFVLCSPCCLFAQETETPDAYIEEYRRALKSGNPDSLALSCCHLSEYYTYRDADSTKKYCLEGLKYVDRDQVEPYVDLLNTLGSYYNSIGDNRMSINTLFEAWRASERLNAGNVLKGDILSSIGVGYRRINMVDSALYYYGKGLTCYQADKEESADNVSFLLTNIAVLYANTSRLDEAESYIRQAMSAVEGSEDMDTRLYVSNSGGAIFILQKKYREAEEIMTSSLEWARREGKSRFVLQCMSPLLSLYHRMGNRKALDRLVKEAQPLIASFSANSNEVLGFQETLAVIYYQEKRFSESVALYHKQLAAHGVSSQTPLENIYLGLARNYSHLNRVSLSADYYEKAYAVLDSIYHSDIEKNLSEFTVKYETQQKELEIARLNEERLRQRNLLMKWSLIVALFGVILILWLVYEVFRRRQQKHRAELDIARSFIGGLEKERTRLAKELHDGICNDLLGIGMMLNLKDKDEETTRAISQSVEAVRAEVRAISHELTPPKFQHTSLDEIVERQLNEIFSPDGMSLSFEKQGSALQWKHIPGNISYEVYRIIQEISSNILLHSEASYIRVRICVTDGGLDFLIVNDGKEFDSARSSGRGIGLSTVHERVKTLGAAFSVSYTGGQQQFKFHVAWKK